MTKLKGMRELAQAIFSGMPVRVGYPNNINGFFNELKDPSFSTVIGLLHYKAGKHTQYEIDFEEELLHSKMVREENLSDIKIGNTIQDIEKTQSNKNIRDSQDNQRQKNSSREESRMLFDDLPDLGQEKKSLKKLANWARQLF